MKKFIDFVTRTSSGMAMGLFATLIIGSIFKQLCSFGEGWETGITIANSICALMGVGIGLGVAYSMRKDLSIIELTSCIVVGGIANMVSLKAYNEPIPTFVPLKPGNPLLVYLAVIATLMLAKFVLRKKTPVDILLIPSFYIVVGTLFSVALIYPCFYVIYGIQEIVKYSMTTYPEIMSIIISVIMGMVLTMPISSVAVCVAIDIASAANGLAAGAAVIGCTAQMIGFAVQSFRAKNSIGKTISVGIGTSMLYWSNIIKKPAIWLPTILTSFILGPIGVCLLGTKCTSPAAGMGSCGLVGQFGMLTSMSYQSWELYVSIFAVQILGTILLTYLFDFLCTDVFHLYTKEDLKLDI